MRRTLQPRPDHADDVSDQLLRRASRPRHCATDEAKPPPSSTIDLLGSGTAEEPPLVIDLDGTLLRSDLLLEMGLAFLRDQPQRLLAPLKWLLAGKAVLKHELAHATDIDVSALPFDRTLLDLIARERGRGRQLVLATATHRRLAQRVAEHLGIFDAVIATDAERNLSAHAKRDALVRKFGDRGFDYVGNSRDDLPVWAAARKAYVVNAPAAVERRARASANVAEVIDTRDATLGAWISALRLHQWLKNLLLFVPLLAAHRYSEVPLLLDALLAFLCFGLCASSAYVLNDLLDLHDDRRHRRKRARSFAAGRLSVQSGLVVSPLLLACGLALATVCLPVFFTIGLASYYCLTLVYSLRLKRYMVVDVMTLATLYTIRIIVGAAALDIPLSFWLLAFSMFMFLSLALVKRYAELDHVHSQGREAQLHGREYVSDDRQMISALGAAAGYMAVMILALYINDSRTTQLYRHHELIWLACPLLLTWISRVWMLAHRGLMNEDPIVFAVRDRPSLLIGALGLLVFWGAL